MGESKKGDLGSCTSQSMTPVRVSMVRACLCKRWGPPSSLEIVEGLPLPNPEHDEVRIAVSACGVNFPDLLIIQGKYQMKPPLPFAPGGEVAGVIIELGSGCKRFRLGDRVVAFVGFGGYTTDLVVKEINVAPLPSGMDFITGASFVLAYGTADYALRVRAKVRTGELVLVLGASGGVGLAAVQLAKAAGATVIAAASTPEKLETCRDSGADFLLNYRDPKDSRAGKSRAGNWRQALKRLVGPRGIDVVLDSVGGADCETALRSMAVGGRYLVIGFASGTIPAPSLNLVLLKEVCVIGIFWGAWLKRDPEGSAQQLKELVRLYGEGLVRPVISRVYPLHEAPRALDDMGARRVVGKLVIDCSEKAGPAVGGGEESRHDRTVVSRL